MVPSMAVVVVCPPFLSGLFHTTSVMCHRENKALEYEEYLPVSIFISSVTFAEGALGM